MNVIEKAFKETKDFTGFVASYLEIYSQALRQLKDVNLQVLVDAIQVAYENDKMIFVMGNGGSAANATHISTGLSYITRSWDKPIRSMSLSCDPILLTSLGNDFSFEEIFYRQLQVHMRPGDLVLALSVSGESKNVLRAVEFARSKGNPTIALVGSDGGKLMKAADCSFHIRTPEAMFGLTEDVHMVLGHALTYYLEYSLK